MEQQIEAFRIDVQVLADLLLAFASQVEAEQKLPVAVEAELGKGLPYLPCLLHRHDLIEHGCTGRERRKGNVFVLRERAETSFFAALGDEQIARRAVEEPGELCGISHLAAADLLEHQGQGLLVEIVGENRTSCEPAEPQEEAAAEAPHELGLGRPVALSDRCDQTDDVPASCGARATVVEARCGDRSHGLSSPKRGRHCEN